MSSARNIKRLLLAWGAFACLIISIIPYMIRCVYRFLLFPVTLHPTRLQHADHVILHLAQLLYVSRMRLRWWLAIKTKHPFISSLLCMTLFVFFTYRWWWRLWCWTLTWPLCIHVLFPYDLCRNILQLKRLNHIIPSHSLFPTTPYYLAYLQVSRNDVIYVH